MTDSTDSADTAHETTGHQWGYGWKTCTRDDIKVLIETGVIGTTNEYDHFDSFEDMAAFILGRGPYLYKSGFTPNHKDYEYINEKAPAGLDWHQCQQTYECLNAPRDSRDKHV